MTSNGAGRRSLDSCRNWNSLHSRGQGKRNTEAALKKLARRHCTNAYHTLPTTDAQMLTLYTETLRSVCWQAFVIDIVTPTIAACFGTPNFGKP